MQRHGHLPIFPIWACKCPKTCKIWHHWDRSFLGMHTSETTVQIWFIQNSMELFTPYLCNVTLICSRLCGTHIFDTYLWIYNAGISIDCLNLCLWAWPWIFNVKVEKPYHRNRRADWPAMKAMWIGRKWDTLRGTELWPLLWPWHWIFKANFWKSCISQMEGSTNMEHWTSCETLSNGLDLKFSRLSLGKAVCHEWEDRLTWNERHVRRLVVGPTMSQWPLILPMILNLDLQYYNFK